MFMARCPVHLEAATRLKRVCAPRLCVVTIQLSGRLSAVRCAVASWSQGPPSALIQPVRLYLVLFMLLARRRIDIAAAEGSTLERP